MDPASLVGTMLDGRYSVVRMIGGGGMGSVYEAQHAGTSRRVAIKVISTGDLDRNSGLVARFQREARAAGAVDSQHIAQVLDTGTDAYSGLPFMVMEYLAGDDAQQLFKRVGPVPSEIALRIAAQACIGLAKAHEAGIVHRDIKPANLFLAQRDAGEVIVKILDFGIAKVKMEDAHATESAGLTRTGSMLGSPLYMSPEQARGAKSIDHRADLWSLGVVLYQALAGRTPYGHIEALGELIIAICYEPPAPIQDLAPWTSPEVAAVVHRALRSDPNERFQTAGEMFAALQPLLPNGWRLSADMLVGISAAERAYVAPRLPPMVDPRAVRASLPSAMEAPGGVTALPQAPTVTDGGLARSSAGQRKPGPRVGLIVGAAATLALGAAAVVKVLASSPPPQPPPVAVQPPPPPAPTASAAAPATAAPVERMVKLVVLPEDATVDVDGEPSAVKGGVVEVRGAPGTVHKVHIASGKSETTEDVVVTESGAMPPKLELVIAKPMAGGPRPKAAAAATAAAAAAPVPAAPNLEHSFE